ncbi:MAG: metallopeptidase [Roseburia sp.]|nr:metallopeptidase [Roseburia sp.]
MPHIQTQTEWEEEMSLKILSFLRNEIYMDLRFLDIALSALTPKADPALKAFATDGAYLYFSTEQLLRVFKTNAPYLDRAYLHTILHCIFSHLWIAPEQQTDERRRRWNLACDIAAEYTIDRLDKPCTKRILSWLRQSIYRELEEQKKGISAAVIYRFLKEKEPEELEALEREFYTDDHCYWPKREDSQARQQSALEQKKKWDKIARQSRMEQQRGDESKEGEELLAAQISAAKSRRSYRDFLQRFTVLREEMKLDPDEFDMNYYTYGLSLYKNMPLIEPLESRESRKIQELVIAIDTSYSTRGELVEHFLRETFDILNQKNSFFQKFKVRILQCDNQVRQDEVVETEQDMERLLQKFTVLGGGSTDFRPVFAYVGELIEQGKIKNLGGLLYFTDGKGTYPKKRPEYRTAFLFLEEFEEEAVPPWAMRVKLEPEEFE